MTLFRISDPRRPQWSLFANFRSQVWFQVYFAYYPCQSESDPPWPGSGPLSGFLSSSAGVGISENFPGTRYPGGGTGPGPCPGKFSVPGTESRNSSVPGTVPQSWVPDPLVPQIWVLVPVPDPVFFNFESRSRIPDSYWIKTL